MAESVMRQGMDTWLKKGCLISGDNFLYAYLLAGNVGKVVADARLRWPFTSEEDVSVSIKQMTDMIEELYKDNQLSDIEYDDMKTRISSISLSLPTEIVFGEGVEKHRAKFQHIEDEIAHLSDKIRLLMYEKVAECQCGKPGGV